MQSNIQALSMNLFRAKLGIGLSPEQKKGPQFRFIPGVGLVQIVVEQTILPPILSVNFDGGNPFLTAVETIDGGGPTTEGKIFDFGKP